MWLYSYGWTCKGHVYFTALESNLARTFTVEKCTLCMEAGLENDDHSVTREPNYGLDARIHPDIHTAIESLRCSVNSAHGTMNVGASPKRAE